jgi:hypothetical protein
MSFSLARSQVSLMYSGCPLDRASYRRADPSWFTQAELAERTASGHPFGRPDSIDRHLLQSWLAEP